ncbi:MAG: sodium:proton antiporter [Gammaproteobacteria bacterium]|nr:sodium:proton antiporter [Gammaproteobacteria bacterium]
MDHHVLQALVIVTAGGIAAQWLAWRLRMPAIVLLTATGLVLGPGFGVLEPSADFGALYRPAIELGVAIILFEGGMNLRWHELSSAASGVRRLVLLGVPISWCLGSAAAYFVGGLSAPVALTLGAIMVVTGPTVILPLLRHARLRQRTASLLKWEGIVNDPIGALLAVLVYDYFVFTGEGAAGAEVAGRLIASVSAALALGLGGGFALAASFRRGWVPEYLKGPVMLMLVLVVFALANAVQGSSGLLAVTICGMVLGNSRLPSIDELRRFKEYIAILLVASVFILLTADLEAATLRTLDWRAVALLSVVIFVVRPVSIVLATLGARMEWRERALIGWIAPRGIVAAAVAGAFAPALVERGYAGADQLVPLIFALIIATVVLHGFSIGWLARMLGLAAARANGIILLGASPWSIDLARLLSALELPVRVVDASWHRLRPARLAGLSVYYGQILSEGAEQALDTSDIGWLLAATDNDAFNALACTRFANELGRNRVYQLPMGAEDDPKGYLPSLRGTIAFGEGGVYEELLRRHFQGWRCQKTRLTEDFSFADYRETLGPDAVILLALRRDGRIVFNTASTPLQAEAEDIVVSFAPERARRRSGQKSADAGAIPADE